MGKRNPAREKKRAIQGKSFAPLDLHKMQPKVSPGGKGLEMLLRRIVRP
jgi:hypothetical protein